ncbi:hypothetical protein [Sphingomonas sp. NFR15]|uniref:hypothetical protein n=1 Tax=Sphingomonas sp. NFR15 TaxID=1566282 RepID=UPI000888D059|nr:hypothetical protein [Sphingomonas sp. NFR15]SDA35735.1 hypothetical protein SAMN03159340_03346 [Sphingomonas sp. NFR15]
MPDPLVGNVIVRHIDELEAALRFAHNTMQPMLAKAIAAVIEDKRRDLAWAGEEPANLDETIWLAPEEWRIPGKPDDDDFYLSFSLDTTPCIDGHEPETWVGTLCGFAGATVRFSASTDGVGQREWKALLRSQGALLDELVDRGFLCDPRTGDIALTIPIDRALLALGFEEETLEAALAPLAAGIDRIVASRSVFDRLVQVIKGKMPS